MIVEIGSLDDLRTMAKKWGHNYQTVLWYIKKANRLNYIIVIRGVVGGYSELIALPRTEFNMETHKMPNRYREANGFLGTNIKRDTIHIFGNDEALGPLKLEVEQAELDKLFPTIGGKDETKDRKPGKKSKEPGRINKRTGRAPGKKVQGVRGRRGKNNEGSPGVDGSDVQ